MQTAAVPSDATQHGEHGRVDAANRERFLANERRGESRELQRTGARVRARAPAAENAATHACHGRATLRRAPLRSRGRTIAIRAQNAMSTRERAFCSVGCSQQRVALAPSATGTRAACLLATL